MAGDDYLDWHTGVEFDRETRTWRGYIKQLDTNKMIFTNETFANKEDAAVAASDLLTAAREGRLPQPG